MSQNVYWDERPIAYFISSFENWNGTVDEWRQAFFTLLSYKNKYSGFLELTINSTYHHVPFLYAVIDAKALNVELVEELLIECGYTPTVQESKARFVDYLDLDEDFMGSWYFE